MTWIKPSFLWMMYRCGWGLKEGQETVLAVEITHEGFEWALRNACLSHYVPASTPTGGLEAPTEAVRRPGSSGTRNATSICGRSRTVPSSSASPARRARRYADEWTVSIADVTPLAREIHALVRAGNLDAAAERLPEERPYPAADDLLSHLRAA